MDNSTFKKILIAILFAVIAFTAMQRLDITLGAIALVLGLFTPLFIGLCMAFLVNVLMIPIEKTIDRNTSKSLKHFKRPIALVVSLLVIAIFVFLLFFMIVPSLQATLTEMFKELPGFWESSKVYVIDYFDSQPLIADTLSDLEIDWKSVSDQLTSYLQSGGASLVQSTFDFTTKVFSTFVNLIIGFIFALYILVQKETLARQIKRLLYAFLKETWVDHLLRIGRLSHKVFSSFVTGQLTDALVLGLLCYFGMLILRFPHALVVSSLVGVTALVPVVGAFIGISVGAFLIVMVSPIKALWFLIFIVILHQLEGNLIYPKIIGDSIGLPGIWVLVAVIVGGGAFGILGMLIGVPLSSVFYALLKETVSKQLSVKKIPKKKYS